MKLESYILGMHIKNTHTHTQMCNNNQMISSMLLIAMVGYSRPKEEVESQGTVETQFWFVLVTWPDKLDENWACKENELICLYEGPPAHIVSIEDDGKEDIFQLKKKKSIPHIHWDTWNINTHANIKSV